MNNGLLGKIIARSDVLLALGFVGIIGVLIIPIPTGLLDFALAFNITFSIIVLIATLYVRKPLELSVFPGMLLIVTLLRLSLNVASTRLILSEAYAGEVINSFGHFVVANNYVVGFIIFIILVVIQLVVITKGASRISEVSARFTLDAMPGKQMAVDSELSAGLINENEARNRRDEISREADFYGSMDGASKFIRGDAIAGLLIILVNIFGGFIIGMAFNGLSITEALKTYTLLTIGDGLVTQIPSLLIATASGIIITRSASSSNLGQDLVKQLIRQPKAILVAAAVLLTFGFLPGMPTFTFIVLGLVVGAVGYASKNALAKNSSESEESISDTDDNNLVEQPEDRLKVERLGLEIGFGLISYVDQNQGGDILNRIADMRQQLASEIGLIVPPVRIRDNVSLGANQYQISIKGNKIDSFEIIPGHLLAINPGTVRNEIDGLKTVDPAFGLNAFWIIPNLKDTAVEYGYTVVEPAAIITTHLTEIIRNHAAEILNRQDVFGLIENLKAEHGPVVDSIIPEKISPSVLQRVLVNFLNENLPIKDLLTIIEKASDFNGQVEDVDSLTEFIRPALKRQISASVSDSNNQINAFTLSDAIEARIDNSKNQIDNSLASKVVDEMTEKADALSAAGYRPVCVCSTANRLSLRKLMSATYPQLMFIASDEIVNGYDLITDQIMEVGYDY